MLEVIHQTEYSNHNCSVVTM